MKKDAQVEVAHSVGSRMIRFFVDGQAEVIGRTLEGDFPVYQAVIPDERKIRPVNVDREGFEAAIHQAAALNKSREVKSVDLIFDDKGGMKVFSEVEGVGKLETFVEAAVPGGVPGLTGTFNPDFLLDFLKSLPKSHSRIVLGVERPSKGKRLEDAITLRDSDEPKAIYILMPITEK
jgi:DNA polymerase III sliding clamp (beta) subunit (PCNA family)